MFRISGTLSYLAPETLIGREAILETLKTDLIRTEPQTICVTGFPGIGKTAVIASVVDDARQIVRELVDAGVIYVLEQGQFMSHPLWIHALDVQPSSAGSVSKTDTH